MLQIISGRFFCGGHIYEAERDAILYTNFSWVAPIRTTVAELRPVNTWGSRVSSYVVRYVNRYERRSPDDPQMFAPGEEAVEQFRLLASFFLWSYFHVDRSRVEALCRTRPDHEFDETLPCNFVPKFFEAARHGNHAEVAEFPGFLDRVLAIPRRNYRRLISCLSGFFDALEALGENFDLAYSMMVYVLEALSRSTDEPALLWNDYDPNQRVRLDRELSSVDDGTALRIRAILLDAQHLRLKKRFVDFVRSHVEDSFFMSEAEGLRSALPKSEFEHALANLYKARSGYVHELRQVQDQLRLNWIASNSDMFCWANDVHFTFAGLVRLVRHVIARFIERQPLLEREDYPQWRSELPGVVLLEMAPQYWAGRAEDFTPEQAEQRFSGFIGHFVASFATGKPEILDLRSLMETIERLTPCSKPIHRVPMLALYWIFNQLIRAEDRHPGSSSFFARWSDVLKLCSIEFLVAHVIGGLKPPWPATECASTFERYRTRRHKPRATRLNRLVELAVMGEIANLFLDGGNATEYDDWITAAILDGAGHKHVQDYLGALRNGRGRVDVKQVLGVPVMSVPQNENCGETPFPITEEEIRAAAYLKWEASGRPTGNPERFWLEAETELQEPAQSVR